MWYLKLMFWGTNWSLNARRYEEIHLTSNILCICQCWNFLVLSKCSGAKLRETVYWVKQTNDLIQPGSFLEVKSQRCVYFIDNNGNYMLVSIAWPSFLWFVQQKTAKANLWQLLLKQKYCRVLGPDKMYSAC